MAPRRRKLLGLARDAPNADYAGHRPAFQLFAQSAPLAQPAAVFRTFDWNHALKFAPKAGGLSVNIWGVTRQAVE